MEGVKFTRGCVNREVFCLFRVMSTWKIFEDGSPRRGRVFYMIVETIIHIVSHPIWNRGPWISPAPFTALGHSIIS